MARGRPGGNPDLKKYAFTTEREESLTELMALRVPASLKAQLRALGNWQEFVRSAIAEKLERDGLL